MPRSWPGYTALGAAAAVADFDGDGFDDLFVANANNLPYLYRNITPAPVLGHWAGFVLEGKASNREAVGARLRLTAGGRTLLRFVDGGNGFAAQSSRRIHFGLGRAGLGTAERIDQLEVLWPSGNRQVFTSLPADRYIRLVEGEALKKK